MRIENELAHGPAASTTAQFLALPAPLHAGASPDGRRLALTTASVAAGDEHEDVRIVILDVVHGTAAPLLAATPGDHSATWSPDGTRLAFITARHGMPQVAVCEVDAAAPSFVSALPAAVPGPASWSPDGRRLAVSAGRGRRVDRTRPWRYTRAVPRFDGIGLLDDPKQLWVVDLDRGTDAMITDDQWWWSLPRWSPDGESIAARASFDPDGHRHGQHLRIARLDGSWHEPDVPGGFAVVPSWASDGSLVTLTFQPAHLPPGSEAQLHRVMPDGTVLRVPTPLPVGGTVYGDSPAAIGDAFEPALLVDGMDIALRTQRGGAMGVAWHSLADGSWHEAVSGHRCATPLMRCPGGLVIADQSADYACRISVVSDDAEQGDAGRVLALPGTASMPPAAAVHRYSVASPHDGAPIEAWHLRPADAQGPIPTVLLVHGGPAAAFGECFLLDAQALCAAGFGVVYANFHGSTGYGDAFTHSILDHWGDIPPADVLAALDEAIARGWADGSRLGIAGLSYGGYLASWLACTSDRFRAAVAENPVTDLLSLYGSSDIGVSFLARHFGATPFERLEPYLGWSPLLRAQGCRTPVLFVVGTDDHRCPPSQAHELHRVLRSLGCVSEVLVLPDASHDGSTFGPVPGRLVHDAALVEWMDRWLRRDDVPPTGGG